MPMSMNIEITFRGNFLVASLLQVKRLPGRFLSHQPPVHGKAVVRRAEVNIPGDDKAHVAIESDVQCPEKTLKKEMFFFSIKMCYKEN